MMSSECLELANSMSDIVARMELRLKCIVVDLSKVDSKINDINHIIEYIDLPANKMSKLTKLLKELYKIRRVYKEDIIVLRNILQNKKDARSEITASKTRVARHESESIDSLIKLIG